MISGLFDLETRLSRIDKTTDPLVALDAMIDWEQFRPTLQTLRDKPRKSTTGAKGYREHLQRKGKRNQPLTDDVYTDD
jgi:hypothetical protein